MADSSTSHLAEEAPAPGSSKAVHGASPDTKDQEDTKGEVAAATSEVMREELVQSAVSFLKHPKGVASSDVQRRSFLENKGLTMDEIEEVFRRLLSPPSNSTSSDTGESQGVSDNSCRTTQVMEMIQRVERPDDIQDINDEPPNPDQPISEPRMAPKPKEYVLEDHFAAFGKLSSVLLEDTEAHNHDTTLPSLSCSACVTYTTRQSAGKAFITGKSCKGHIATIYVVDGFSWLK
ncbi:hypothetical protein ACQ4PT_045221 [Festuca glaucescens]